MVFVKLGCLLASRNSAIVTHLGVLSCHSVLAEVCGDRGAVIDQRVARLDDADRQTLAEAVRIMHRLLDDAQRHR
jgi:hypothetical protein